MSDELVRRFAPRVAETFPVRDGESFDDYCSRLRGENHGRRAFVAVHIFDAIRDLKAERSARKAEWIAAARLVFNPGQRRPCIICGKYEGLTEAHHTVPLGVQFDAGATIPIQAYDWLCPTHHAAQHVFITQLIANVTSSIPGLPPEESDALHRLGVKFVDLVTRLPNWGGVRK